MPTQNLVQIQRDLQSLPPGPQTMMYLKRAKDGMVASVPPYVAAAELSAREKTAQREALASGAAPGGKPTVSQQLSQKADLLALQAMKKREMDAASMNQARTAVGPAPEGAPKPQEQPQPEGGLASLPVEFGFEGGGIVAFDAGGSTNKKPSLYDLRRDPLIQALNNSQPTERDIAGLDPYVDENGNPRSKSQIDAIIAAQERLRGVQQNASDYEQLLARKRNMAQQAAVGRGPSESERMREFYPTGAWARKTAEPATGSPPDVVPPPPAVVTPPVVPAAAAPQQGSAPSGPALPGASQQPPRPPAPPGAPQQRPPVAPGAQGAAPQQPAAPSPQQALEDALMKRLGIAPGTPGLPAAAAAGAPAQDMAGTAADVKAAQAAFGLNTPAGEEERQMIAEMRARHAQQQQERARMGLKAVLGGFNRGYGGAAAADVAASQQAYAEDMAHQKSMYDLINAINKGNRGEAEKAFEKTIGLKQEREKEAGASSRAELQAKVNMHGNLLQARSSEYSADLHYKAAMANARLTSDRAGLEERKLKIDGLQSAERGIQQELTKLQGLMDKDSKQRRAELDANLKSLREQIARLSGVEPVAPSGTASTAATANRPPLASFQR